MKTPDYKRETELLSAAMEVANTAIKDLTELVWNLNALIVKLQDEREDNGS